MEYVALLRGINVGGKNKVVMSELREQVADAGYGNVRTYINSGNLLFEADAPRDEVAQSVEALLESHYPFPIRVALLSGQDYLAELSGLPEWWHGDVARRDALFYTRGLDRARVRERIEAMSSQELAAEIERIRPGDPNRLAEADSTVIEARMAVERLSEQREGAAKAKALAERQEAAWRLQHAYKAKLHDSGLWRSQELDDLDEQQEAAQTRLDEVGPRLVRAREQLQHVRTVAQARITDEQKPARERVAELEEIHQGKVRQERLDAEWRARKARERAERNQVLNDFELLAAYRRNRFHGFRDGGRQWEATPGPLRELVDRFNAMTGAQQLETLEVLGRDHDRNARLGELLRDRAQAIELDQEQDRGLSF